MEPSGRKFNDMELDYNKQPHNPMVGKIIQILYSLLVNFQTVSKNMSMEKLTFLGNLELKIQD